MMLTCRLQSVRARVAFALANDEVDEAREPSCDSARNFAVAENHADGHRPVEPLVGLGAVLARHVQLCSHALVKDAQLVSRVIVKVPADGLLVTLLVHVEVADVQEVQDGVAHAEEEAWGLKEVVLAHVLSGVCDAKFVYLAFAAGVRLLLQPLPLRRIKLLHRIEESLLAEAGAARQRGATRNGQVCSLEEKRDAGEGVAHLNQQGESVSKPVPQDRRRARRPWQL
eukprot:6214537-Pleurochrysis_carterae.AAC.2